MKKAFSLLLILMISISCVAEEVVVEEKFAGPANWSNFEHFMALADQQNQKLGWSFVASGVLVMVGGTLGAQATDDNATKLVYGLAATLGVGAAGYGLERLYNGNNYLPLYEALHDANLTGAQRDQIVERYIKAERERETIRKRIAMVTSLVMTGMNLYAASATPDKANKNFFYAFAAVNLGLAFSYTF